MIVGRWLDAVGTLSVLVTSRQPLRIRGEVLMPVLPLSVEEGARLFVARARAAGRALPDEAAESAEVAALVALLDCMPLAILLAASRARLLSPAMLLSRMNRRFELLQSRSAELPLRQRTLEATLQWSWERLPDAERAALAQLSVFEDGITLEAAEDVLALPEDAGWTEDVLAELVDHSLLISAPSRHAGLPRLRMLVSVQEFAAGQLDDAARQAAEARHRAHFSRWGTDEARAALMRSGGEALERALLDELPNLVAASRRPGGDPEQAALCAIAAADGYRHRGPLREGLALIEAALSREGLPDARRAALLRHAGTVALLLQRPEEALTRYTEALALSRACGERRHRDTILEHMGYVNHKLGRAEEGHRLTREALALGEAQGVDRGVMLIRRADLKLRQGARAEARVLFEEALQVVSDRGEQRREQVVLSRLSHLCFLQGAPEPARVFCRRALRLARSRGDRLGESGLLQNLGHLHGAAGQLEDAAGFFEHSIRLSRQLGRMIEVCAMLGHLGALRERMGEPESARRRYAEAIALAEERGVTRGVAEWRARLAALTS